MQLNEQAKSSGVLVAAAQRGKESRGG